jgi:hypothetical protein
LAGVKQSERCSSLVEVSRLSSGIAVQRVSLPRVSRSPLGSGQAKLVGDIYSIINGHSSQSTVSLQVNLRPLSLGNSRHRCLFISSCTVKTNLQCNFVFCLVTLESGADQRSLRCIDVDFERRRSMSILCRCLDRKKDRSQVERGHSRSRGGPC